MSHTPLHRLSNNLPSALRWGLISIMAIIATIALFAMMAWMVSGQDELPEAQPQAMYQMVMAEQASEESDRRERQAPEMPETIQPPEMPVSEPVTEISTPTLETRVEPMEMPELSLSPFDVAIKMPQIQVEAPKPKEAAKPTSLKPTASTPKQAASSVSSNLPATNSSQASAPAAPTGITREASLVSQPHPAYPRRMQQRNIEGYVIFSFDINEEGKPENVKVVKFHPNKAFVRPAEQAIKRWRYKPKMVNGQAVKQANKQATVNFKLTK